MLGGPGVHKEFGWKPIAKYILNGGAVTQTIDPLPCTFERTVRMICQWDRAIYFTINADGGNNYSMSKHLTGSIAGAAHHTQAKNDSYTKIKLDTRDIHPVFSDCLFQKQGNLLMVMGQACAYSAANNYILNNLVGFYAVAGPYTTIEFHENNDMAHISGEVQFFESVYGF